MTQLQILGIIYYVFAYAAALAMYCSGTLYVALGGCAIFFFLTYQLIEQFSYQEEEE
jgi:uncharacterized protein (DUF2062 family)